MAGASKDQILRELAHWRQEVRRQVDLVNAAGAQGDHEGTAAARPHNAGGATRAVGAGGVPLMQQQQHTAYHDPTLSPWGRRSQPTRTTSLPSAGYSSPGIVLRAAHPRVPVADGPAAAAVPPRAPRVPEQAVVLRPEPAPQHARALSPRRAWEAPRARSPKAQAHPQLRHMSPAGAPAPPVHPHTPPQAAGGAQEHAGACMEHYYATVASPPKDTRVPRTGVLANLAVPPPQESEGYDDASGGGDYFSPPRGAGRSPSPPVQHAQDPHRHAALPHAAASGPATGGSGDAASPMAPPREIVRYIFLPYTAPAPGPEQQHAPAAVQARAPEPAPAREEVWEWGGADPHVLPLQAQALAPCPHPSRGAPAAAAYGTPSRARDIDDHSPHSNPRAAGVGARATAPASDGGASFWGTQSMSMSPPSAYAPAPACSTPPPQRWVRRPAPDVTGQPRVCSPPQVGNEPAAADEAIWSATTPTVQRVPAIAPASAAPYPRTLSPVRERRATPTPGTPAPAPQPAPRTAPRTFETAPAPASPRVVSIPQPTPAASVRGASINGGGTPVALSGATPPTDIKGSLDLLAQAVRSNDEEKERLRVMRARGAEHHRANLTALLRRHAPSELGSVDALLMQHKGCEDELFSALLRRFHGPGGGDADPQGAWRTIFTEFYKTHNPAKVGELDAILKIAAGREAVVFRELQRKYAAPHQRLAGASHTSRQLPAPSGEPLLATSTLPSVFDARLTRLLAARAAVLAGYAVWAVSAVDPASRALPPVVAPPPSAPPSEPAAVAGGAVASGAADTPRTQPADDERAPLSRTASLVPTAGGRGAEDADAEPAAAAAGDESRSPSPRQRMRLDGAAHGRRGSTPAREASSVPPPPPEESPSTATPSPRPRDGSSTTATPSPPPPPDSSPSASPTPAWRARPAPEDSTSPATPPWGSALRRRGQEK